MIIVKEGMIEATWDGHTQTAGPGSVIFFASHATTRLRNPGKVPATYTVIYYYTPLTPKVTGRDTVREAAARCLSTLDEQRTVR